jgi:hypothetical protein
MPLCQFNAHGNQRLHSGAGDAKKKAEFGGFRPQPQATHLVRLAGKAIARFA